MPPSEPEAVYSINEGTEKVLLGGITTPSGSPLHGGERITKRFPLLCKEGLGVVVQDSRTFAASS